MRSVPQNISVPDQRYGYVKQNLCHIQNDKPQPKRIACTNPLLNYSKYQRRGQGELD